MAYFGNYQRIYVSIETSAKCRQFTVMRLRADTFFFKIKFIYSRGIVTQFCQFMMFLLSIIGFYGVEKLKGKYVFRKFGTIYVWYIVSTVAQNEILWTSAIQAVSRQCFRMLAVKLNILQNSENNNVM